MMPDAVKLGELDVDGRRLSLGWSLCAAQQLNFTAEELKPADAATLMIEPRKAVKLTHTSRYIGVHWSKQTGRWQSTIWEHYRLIHIGYYPDERARRRGVRRQAIELRGPQARLNFHPMTGEQVWGTRLRELVGPDRPGAPRSASRHGRR